MAKAIELNIMGIKCDHCDYKEPDVKFVDYEKWLNKPCPKCGENLLTEADLNSLKALIQISDVANQLFPDGFDGDKRKAKMFIEMNGTGKMDLKLKE